MSSKRKIIQILLFLSHLRTSKGNSIANSSFQSMRVGVPKQIPFRSHREPVSHVDSIPRALSASFKKHKVQNDVSVDSSGNDRTRDGGLQLNDFAGLTKNQILDLLSAASDSVNEEPEEQQESRGRFNAELSEHLPVRRSISTAGKTTPQSAPIKKHRVTLKSLDDMQAGGLQSNDIDNTPAVNSHAKDLPGHDSDLTNELAGLVGLQRNDLSRLTRDQVMDLISSASSDSIERSQHSEFDGERSSDASLRGDNGEISKTCGIAMRAAEEAKAASQAQNSAGLQAAKEVKLQLAEKAQRAANAAQAALAEKQNEMHMLEDQMHDAETVMLEEHDSLNQTRQNVDTAGKTVLSAKEQYKALEEALKLSKETIASAEELAQGAQHELNEKVKLMTAAKSKVAELERELDRSKKEYANTRDSAVRAAEAAKEAQINANQNSK